MKRNLLLVNRGISVWLTIVGFAAFATQAGAQEFSIDLGEDGSLTARSNQL